jgi:hypothetical protein
MQKAMTYNVWKVLPVAAAVAAMTFGGCGGSDCYTATRRGGLNQRFGHDPVL